MTQVVLPNLNQTGVNEWEDVEGNDRATRDVVNGQLDNDNIKAGAAIAHSKLADATAGQLLIANASGVIVATTMSGDATIDSAGVVTVSGGGTGAPGPNSVGSTEIIDGSIATVDIADSAITGAKISDGTVTSVELASAAVTNAKLGDGSVTSLKLGSGAVTLAKMATSSVGSSQLVTDAVTSTKIAADAVGSSEIAANAVGSSEIGSLPGARVHHGSTQSVADNTLSILAFSTERFDTDTIHDTGASNARLTATTAGVYLITASIEWAGNAAGNRFLGLDLNATTRIAGIRQRSDTGLDLQQTISTIYKLAASDFVRVEVHQNSGGALNVLSAANYSPEFSMHWLGDG